MVMTFTDLEFQPRAHLNGIQAVRHFTNGYGVSVVCGEYTYGGEQGLYEVAILQGDDICYDTPITDDVIGWLTPAMVTDIMTRVQALEAING